jgi:hypothetical protein
MYSDKKAGAQREREIHKKTHGYLVTAIAQ